MDTKELTELIQGAVDELHKATDRQDAEIKAQGVITGETKTAVEKIQTDITGLLASRDEAVKAAEAMEVKLQRQSIPSAEGETPQTAEAKARTAAFFKYVRGGEAVLTPEERKALVEDATGQYLITPELEAEIERTLPKITIVRPLATRRPITKDRLKLRSLAEVSIGWGKLETGGDIPESSPVPGAPTYQYAEDLYGLAKIGEDELQDSDFNLQTLLADSFTRAIAEAEDKAFIIGSGHDSEEPEGITVNAILRAACVTGTAAAAVTIEKFMEVVYTCPPQHRKNGKWIVNSTVELAIRQLRSETDATYKGPFLWQPSLVAGAPNTFLGYPIYNQDDMEDLSDTGYIAIFGDIKAGYRIIDRAGMSMQRLTELYSEAGLVGFKVHKRVGGGTIKPANKAIVLMKESA